MRQKRRYTKEQIEYIRSIAEGRTRQEITDLFNGKYNETRTLRSIGSIMSRNKIFNNMQGHATRFKKGHKPWNKDMKGLNLGGEKGWFKKGLRTPMQKEVGEVSYRSDPRTGKDWKIIKIAEPNKWKLYHHYLWEKHNGEIPKGHVVTFKDNNINNFDIDNLMLVSRSVLTKVIRQDLREDNPKLNVLAHQVAELDLTIKDAEEKCIET